jgi:hypothetical protein
VIVFSLGKNIAKSGKLLVASNDYFAEQCVALWNVIIVGESLKICKQGKIMIVGFEIQPDFTKKIIIGFGSTPESG